MLECPQGYRAEQCQVAAILLLWRPVAGSMRSSPSLVTMVAPLSGASPLLAPESSCLSGLPLGADHGHVRALPAGDVRPHGAGGAGAAGRTGLDFFPRRSP